MDDNNNNGSKLLFAFLAGAAIGAAVGYFLNSDKKDELLEDLKESALKIKDDLQEGIEKGKSVIDNIIKTAKEQNKQATV
jgi:gas vesicle protein